MEFEWEPAKARTNLEKHGIDFEDAVRVFDGPVLLRSSDRAGEPRWLVVGLVESVTVAIVFTIRGERRRLISARKASRHEREAYYQARARAAQAREDELEGPAPDDR